MRTIGREQMLDISVGGGFLGAGGGGSVREGAKLVDRILQFGTGVELASADEIDDEAWGAVIAGMGSPVASRSNPRTYSPTWAMETLAEAMGFEAAFVIPFETGAGNSLTPMQVAIQKNIPVVDGDPVGRAGQGLIGGDVKSAAQTQARCGAGLGDFLKDVAHAPSPGPARQL